MFLFLFNLHWWQREFEKLVLRNSDRILERLGKLHCVLGGGTQHRALLRYQSEEVKILNISFPELELNP